MSDFTTVTGVVGSIPNHRVTASGLPITSFRLASDQRRFDKAKNAWVDGETNWYTVSAFRHLAFNVARSLNKGDHVMVTGRLRIRDWESQDRRGTAVDLDADSVGHDLFWCTTTAVRSAPSAAATATAAAEGAAPDREGEQPGVAGWAEPPAQAVRPDGFLPELESEFRDMAHVDS